MIEYKYGDEIELNGINLKLKIKGIMPASQPIRLDYSGELMYNVEFEGRYEYIKASFLDMLVSKSVKGKISDGEKVKTEMKDLIIEDKEQKDENKQVIKKLRGRPRKI